VLPPTGLDGRCKFFDGTGAVEVVKLDRSDGRAQVGAEVPFRIRGPRCQLIRAAILANQPLPGHGNAGDDVPTRFDHRAAPDLDGHLQRVRPVVVDAERELPELIQQQLMTPAEPDPSLGHFRPRYRRSPGRGPDRTGRSGCYWL